MSHFKPVEIQEVSTRQLTTAQLALHIVSLYENFGQIAAVRGIYELSPDISLKAAKVIIDLFKEDLVTFPKGSEDEFESYDRLQFRLQGMLAMTQNPKMKNGVI